MIGMPIKHSQRQQVRGFTLLELLVTILILGILTTVALPSFQSFITNQRIRSASFDVMSMISLARSEAIKRNTNVSLKMDATGSVFQVIANGIASPIRQQEMPKGLSINCINQLTNTAVSCPVDGIIYNTSGRLDTAFDTPLEIKSSTANTNTSASCISIDLSGLPKSKKANC
ncbi:MAG: GspH/FimT family pseudopilin [Gallionellaceae bacterium]|jgi:type IV fimbrial biogenesis protein FimT